MNRIEFRFAQENDGALILDFVRGLAEYEKLSDEVVATDEILKEWIFRKKKAEVIFAMDGEKEVGIALFFHSISLYTGRPGIYLEDLFVKPECRGKGFGKGLLKKLASIAVERGCAKFEWICLDWNKPSIDFYLSLGAVPVTGKSLYRESDDSLLRLSTPESDEFRFADERDVPLILDFVRSSAGRAGKKDEVISNENLLEDLIFVKKKAEVIFALSSGREVGFAVFFNNFSTFQGRAGIYIEDFYILPEYRGKGFGKGLMKKLASVTTKRECGRLEWRCADDDAEAVSFCTSADAERMTGWTIYREEGDALKKLAE